jgi:hypothetical protein
VESFTIDTEVPRALWLPDVLEDLQERRRKPRGACQVPIRGDFSFYCHLEEHMMLGLAGLVRARERIWVTEQVLAALDIELPYDDGNCCPDVDGTLPCAIAQRNPEMPGMPGMGSGECLACPCLAWAPAPQASTRYSPRRRPRAPGKCSPVTR